MKNRRPLEEVSVPLSAQWTWTSSFFSPMHGLLPSVLWLLPEGYTWARNNRCLTRGLPTCWGSWLTGVAVWKDRGLTERKQLSGQAKRSEMRVAGRWQTRRRGLWSEEMVRQTQMCELFWRREADRSMRHWGWTRVQGLPLLWGSSSLSVSGLKAFLDKFPSAWFPFFLALSFSFSLPSVIEHR